MEDRGERLRANRGKSTATGLGSEDVCFGHVGGWVGGRG